MSEQVGAATWRDDALLTFVSERDMLRPEDPADESSQDIFWCDQSNGFSSYALRRIADELDRRNDEKRKQARKPQLYWVGVPDNGLVLREKLFLNSGNPSSEWANLGEVRPCPKDSYSAIWTYKNRLTGAVERTRRVDQGTQHDSIVRAQHELIAHVLSLEVK